MIQVIEQTDEEQMAMYMRFPKEEIIKMLIECNKILRRRLNAFGASSDVVVGYPNQCIHNFVQYDCQMRKCTHCGIMEPISFSPYNI